MDDKYRKWIVEKLASEDPFVACDSWTEEMQAKFPELTRVRGEVLLSNGWTRHHWWMVDAEGNVVDPTADQFRQDYYGTNGKTKVLIYSPRDESEPEPTGMCPNCGGYCYTGGTCCSDACHTAYAAYCMSGGSW